MKTLKLGGHTVKIYDDIETLPIVRFHRYNKMLLLDAGIGSDMVAVANHIERAKLYLRDRDENALTELDNLMQSVMMIHGGLSPRHLSFACLVAEVDGHPTDDISDDGLKATLSLIGNTPTNELEAESLSVKKKIDIELTAYFPGKFDTPAIKEHADNVKRLARMMLDTIGGENRTEEMQSLQDRMRKDCKPPNFRGAQNAEIQHDRNFENMCLILSQELHANPKRMTVMEYYNAAEFIERQANQRKKLYRK